MDYIKLFTDMETDHFSELEYDEIGMIVMAALHYASTGEEPEYEKRSVLSLTWKRMKRHIDQSEAIAEKNKANASERKRKQAKASERKRTQATVSETVYEQEQEQEYTQEQEQEYTQEQEHKSTGTRKRFIAPTVEEVDAYCQERRNGVNPQRFVDYYQANGWRVGKNPMKDWKASVRTWEKNGYDGGNRDSPSDNGVLRQRNYDADYFASLEVDLTK